MVIGWQTDPHGVFLLISIYVDICNCYIEVFVDMQFFQYKAYIMDTQIISNQYVNGDFSVFRSTLIVCKMNGKHKRTINCHLSV